MPKPPGRRSLPLALLLTLLCRALAAGQTYEVGGARVEVRLTADQPTVMLGEPTYLSFTIYNHSGRDLQTVQGGDYRNALGRPESFSVRAVGGDGAGVPQPEVKFNMGGLVGYPKIPAGGSYTFRLFLPHWATFERPGEYTVTCEKSLPVWNYGEAGAGRKTDAAQVRVRTKIKVVPADPSRMGALIDRLGALMFDGNWPESREAAQALSYIDDERVIPHFLRAVESRHKASGSELLLTALHALAKFEGDAALEGLKSAAADPDDSTRHGAAAALSRSRHPRAAAALLAMRRDAYYAVRLTVLHMLGASDSTESRALIEEMTGDEHELVNREARRYLSERAARPRP